jgi:protein-tyrosine-phosphatase/predicted ATP-grasp superfamily ATP-dependent carboligase
LRRLRPLPRHHDGASRQPGGFGAEPWAFAATERRGRRRKQVTGGKVLVLGDDTRSFLATVRSLGRQGIEVHVAPANFRSPALRSRYIAAIHDVPPWMDDGAEWLRAIESLLRAERFDLVIPCNETAMLPLQHHAARLAPLARLAIPDDHAIDVLFDKHATRELARQVDVPVAAGRLARPDDTAEAVLAELGAPVVVKPRRSYTLGMLASRGSAQIVRDPAILAQLLATCEHDGFVLERFFPGQGLGVSVLASHGRVLQAFEHHRVRERAGASFYRVSAPLTPDLVRACEAIVAAIPYTGLAMFEFKRDAAGGWILLEVNARPWGSMPLPLALGVDFPYRWYLLLTAGEETPSVPYRVGVYGRNMVPDLRTSLSELADRSPGPVGATAFVLRSLGELSRVLVGREVHDVLVRDDPRPGVAELWDAADAAGLRLARVLPGATAWQRRGARTRAARVLRSAPGKPRVLFVCQGNICRSPFAESLMRSRLGDDSIAVGSAGMLPRPGRPPPPLGLKVAAEHGIDLAAHRSVWLTRETAEAASLVVVFDEVNRGWLFDRYPALKVPVIRLDDLNEPGEIADPDGRGLAEFRLCYERIAAGIEALLALAGR